MGPSLSQAAVVALELPAAAQPEWAAMVLIDQQEAESDYQHARSLVVRFARFGVAVG
jgi:hypothetical protein